MERLTGRYETGLVYVPQGMMPEALDRLAAYEDTGLEPDDLKSNVDVDFVRIIELLRADGEGRLVVLDEPRLPLIWGDDSHDTILCPNCARDLMGGFELAESCETKMVQCPHCGQPVDGTKALTREEAERALEANKNVGNKGKKPTE